jgi:hypothetical protein
MEGRWVYGREHLLVVFLLDVSMPVLALASGRVISELWLCTMLIRQMFNWKRSLYQPQWASYEP